MKKTYCCLLSIILFAGLATANPISISINTYDRIHSNNINIMYSGIPVPTGRLVQIIRPNRSIHPPQSSGNFLGMPASGDTLISTFAIGTGTFYGGSFSVVLTGQTAFPIDTRTPNTLNAGTQFYLRVWAEISATASVPFISGSHFVDGGLFIIPSSDSTLYAIQVNPSSSAPNWQPCGLSVPPEISVTETDGSSITNPVNFGSIYRDSTITHTIRITNRSLISLSLGNGVSSGDFHNNLSRCQLASGEYLDVLISFTPSQTGTRLGTFEFTNSGSGGICRLELSGSGLPTPIPSFQITMNGLPLDSVIDFETVRVNECSDRSFVIMNNGPGTLRINSLQTGSCFYLQNHQNSYTVSPNVLHNYLEIVVRFCPDASGVYRSRLSFSCNALDSSFSVDLCGTGNQTVWNPWSNGQMVAVANPYPGANVDPWVLNFPDDPNTNNIPPIGMTFYGGFGRQPDEVYAGYEVNRPGYLPTRIALEDSLWSVPYDSSNSIHRWWDFETRGLNNSYVDIEFYFTDNDLPSNFGDPRTHNPQITALVYFNSYWKIFLPRIELFEAGTPNVWRATVYNPPLRGYWSLSTQFTSPSFTCNAIPGNNRVTLNWSATEDHNLFFNIYRKMENDSNEYWNSLGSYHTIALNGISNIPVDYQFVDSVGLVNGRSYAYRIYDQSMFGQIVLRGELFGIIPGGLNATENIAQSITGFRVANYPNPFNSSTTISYSLPASGTIDLKLFDLSGREIRSLEQGYRATGSYRIQVDGSALASGTYFLRLMSNNQIVTRKIVLLR